jgi:hypothetical protein
MSAKQTQPGSLSRAQDRIERLLSELNSTVEDVDRLTRAGSEAEALAMLEEQRESLYRIVDQISHDVAAASPPSRWMLLRRHMVAAAAAALMTVSAVAVSVGALTRSPDPIEDASGRLRRASQIADPAERLRIIVTVYRDTRSAPASERQALDRDIALQARRGSDELDDGNVEDPTLSAQADQIMADLQEGKTPAAPDAPSSDKPPSDTVGELFGK